MYTYAYSKDAIDSSLTSSATFYSFQQTTTTYGIASNTSSYIELSTYTSSSAETYTSGQTYTITDYSSTTTSTCDYSATTSSSAGSTVQSGGTSTTTNYVTISHSTNGTHSVSERTRIAYLYSSSQTSYTENCDYNYFATQAVTNSTSYGTTRTRITGSTIYHTPYGTHTVSSLTRDIYLNLDSSVSYTGLCDYNESSSIISTTGSTDYGGYTLYTTVSTVHDIYGYHTVISRTLEAGSSNASQTRSETFLSESTWGSTITYGGTTTETRKTVESQTRTDSLVNTGSSTTSTLVVGFTASYSTSQEYNTVIYSGSSYVLTGLTDTAANSTGYSKGIYYTTSSAVSVINFVIDQEAYYQIDTKYYQPEVSKGSSSTYFSVYYNASNYETQAYVENGVKKYITQSNSTSQSVISTDVLTSELTTTYTSTRQTSSAFGNLSLTTTTSAQVFLASITSATKSSTQTYTLGSSSGTSTITSTRTYSGFGTTTTLITHTIGTQDTINYTTFSSSKSLNWWTYYVRNNGQVLFVPTKSDAVSGSYYPLSSVGFTTTRWGNDGLSRTTSASSYVAGSFYTQSYASTWTIVPLSKITQVVPAGLTVSPWYAANYGSIENAYAFSYSSYNPDTSIFSIKEYADTGSVQKYSVTYDGVYSFTVQSLGGGTSTSSAIYTISSVTETGYARKIKPMSLVLHYNTSVYPTITALNTSNTVLFA